MAQRQCFDDLNRSFANIFWKIKLSAAMGLLRRCAKPKNVTFVQEQQQVMAGEKESRKFHFAEPLAANTSDSVRRFPLMKFL